MAVLSIVLPDFTVRTPQRGRKVGTPTFPMPPYNHLTKTIWTSTPIGALVCPAYRFVYKVARLTRGLALW